jgi:dTDP-glucose 4,6-dehydratase
MKKAETILVTGGCGFIGSNFLRLLWREGYPGMVVNVDALTYAGNIETLKGLDFKSYAFFPWDIADRTKMSMVFEKTKPDIVVNFAAESHVDRSLSDSAPFERTNVKGTEVMLEMARKYGVKKYIQISTDEVYGDIGEDGEPTDEEAPIRPGNPYSESKADADALVRGSGLNWCITRCTNNYGPHQFPEKFIPVMITKAMNGESLPVYGDGQQIRDWIHVEDHCHGIRKVIEHGKGGNVYNFGGDNEQRNIDVAKAILRTLAKPESQLDFVEDRKNHDFRYSINFAKAERELGWVPGTRWKQGLMDTVLWYRDNGDWWLPLLSRGK